MERESHHGIARKGSHEEPPHATLPHQFIMLP
jgi:hypothetical protein